MEGIIKHLSFNKRDIPLPADYRSLYKIGHILMILSLSCRSGKSSMMKLHFLCWSIKNKKNISIVSNWINTGFRGEIHIWGVEPTVNRAIAFAIGDNLINNIGGEYTITERGDSLFKLMKTEKGLFSKEKEFLIWLGKNTITEQKVKELASKFQ